jgi:hypothetical protein
MLGKVKRIIEKFLTESIYHHIIDKETDAGLS